MTILTKYDSSNIIMTVQPKYDQFEHNHYSKNRMIAWTKSRLAITWQLEQNKITLRTKNDSPNKMVASLETTGRKIRWQFEQNKMTIRTNIMTGRMMETEQPLYYHLHVWTIIILSIITSVVSKVLLKLCIVHANQQPVTFIFIIDPNLFTWNSSLSLLMICAVWHWTMCCPCTYWYGAL